MRQLTNPALTAGKNKTRKNDDTTVHRDHCTVSKVDSQESKIKNNDSIVFF